MPKIIIPIIASLFVASQFVPTEANVVGQRGGNLAVVKEPEYQGDEFTADLPLYEHFKNIGGTDGAGMCVLSSIELAALFHGMEDLRGVRNYWAQRERGGAWPGKVDDQLGRYFKLPGKTSQPYMQFESRDPQKIAQVLELINKTGRMACCTYGYSPRYAGKISHMVCSPHFGKYCAILDNNFPGSYEIMTREEGIRRMMDTSGAAWIFVWLTSPPPPPPKN